MSAIDKDSVRYRVLESAKNFKVSWIGLGQALYSVWKEKAYKEWGYMTFDAYTQKEIGVRKATAMKLLKSYYFLEKEEPACLEKGYSDSQPAAALPSYESVNVLRLAKSKNNLDGDDYERFRKDILDTGKDAGQARRELASLIRQREEPAPEEARARRKAAAVRRAISSLKALKAEVAAQRLLPANLIKEVSALINKLEMEIR